MTTLRPCRTSWMTTPGSSVSLAVLIAWVAGGDMEAMVQQLTL